MIKKVAKNINLGIEILRFFLSFWIVIIHCSIINQRHKKYLLKHFHVPTFILISFFFYHRVLVKIIIEKIISRFQRLLIPYIYWPTIVFIINNFFISIPTFGIPIKFTLKELFIQFLIGNRIHGIFWFQFNLLFLSLLFTLIFFIYKESALKIITVLGIISFYFHLSRLSYNFFIDYKGFCGRNLGSLIELIPMGVIGCIISSRNINFIELKKNPIFTSFITSFIIFILFKYDIFIYQPGFRYPNVFLNIIASTFLFIFFSSIPFEKIRKEKYKLFIKIATNFTGGIYYTHPIFRDYLAKYTNFFRQKNYLTSSIIYIICYIFCLIGSKLTKNYKLKYLFI